MAEERRDSLRDERRGDRVLHQNWQGDHLAELHSRGIGCPAEGLVHGEPPGAPGHLLQELTLGGHGCRQARGEGVERNQMNLLKNLLCLFFRWGDELGREGVTNYHLKGLLARKHDVTDV